MGRRPIGEKPLSNAEKQRRFRASQKAKLETLQAQYPDAGVQDMTVLRESIKQELKKTWEPELKAEKIAAQRKQGRELAKKADQSRSLGRITGICEAAVFFIGRDRSDIAQNLLAHFNIDRENAESALQVDKRTKSLTLESLDKSKAWGKPPKVIK